MMFKHTNVPPNCHSPNHTTNHTWNFKIRQHLHLISSNFVHHPQVHNFSTQPQTPKVLGPSMLLTSSIHCVCYSISSFYLSSSKLKSLLLFFYHSSSLLLPTLYLVNFLNIYITIFTIILEASPPSSSCMIIFVIFTRRILLFILN